MTSYSKKNQFSDPQPN